MANPKGGPGRRAGYTIDPRVRERIRVGVLLQRLESIANGEVEAQPHQVTAALGLLKKVLPDLQAIQHTGEDGGPLTVTINKIAAP